MPAASAHLQDRHFAMARAFDAEGAAYLLPRRRARRRRAAAVLPGFGLSLGVAVVYLSLVVLLPLSAAFVKTSHEPPTARSHAMAASSRLSINNPRTIRHCVAPTASRMAISRDR